MQDADAHHAHATCTSHATCHMSLGHIHSRHNRKKRKFLDTDEDDTVIRTPAQIEAAAAAIDAATTTAAAAKVATSKYKQARKETHKPIQKPTQTVTTPALSAYKTLKASHQGDPIADIWGGT